MEQFPTNKQTDLVLTSSVNWSSDTKQIIENDAKEFNEMLLNKDENDLFLGKSMLHTPMSNNINNNLNNNLNMSWGIYFASKSPPMGDLCGSHGIHQRPQFNNNHTINDEQKSSELISEKNDLNTINNKQEIEEEDEEENVNDDDMVMINIDDINKSLEDINFNEFNVNEHYLSSDSNRDSNSTQKSNQSTDSQKLNKLIKIPKLKYNQRFYQFSINKKQLNDNNDIEKQIEIIILKYIQSFYQENITKAHLSAITYQPGTNKCTVLILFHNDNNNNNNNDNDKWIHHFLSFPQITKILDKTVNPFFTELTST